MKQIMLMMAPASGHIHCQANEGCVLTAGDLVASLDLDDPEAVAKSEPFLGGFPEMGPPLVAADSVEHQFRTAESAVDMILAGMTPLHSET